MRIQPSLEELSGLTWKGAPLISKFSKPPSNTFETPKSTTPFFKGGFELCWREAITDYASINSIDKPQCIQNINIEQGQGAFGNKWVDILRTSAEYPPLTDQCVQVTDVHTPFLCQGHGQIYGIGYSSAFFCHLSWPAEVYYLDRGLSVPHNLAHCLRDWKPQFVASLLDRKKMSEKWFRLVPSVL